MFLVPFFGLQNFILLVRTVPFLRKLFFISSYTVKNNYFLLYELIQDLPYLGFFQPVYLYVPFITKNELTDCIKNSMDPDQLPSKLCLFGLILYIPVNIFFSPSWVEPVLLKDTMQCRR